MFRVVTCVRRYVLRGLRVIRHRTFRLHREYPTDVMFVERLFRPSIGLRRYRMDSDRGTICFLLIRAVGAFRPRRVLEIANAIFQSVHLGLNGLRVLRTHRLVRRPLNHLVRVLVIVSGTTQRLRIVVSILKLFPRLPCRRSARLLSVGPGRRAIRECVWVGHLICFQRDGVTFVVSNDGSGCCFSGCAGRCVCFCRILGRCFSVWWVSSVVRCRVLVLSCALRCVVCEDYPIFFFPFFRESFVPFAPLFRALNWKGTVFAPGGW